MLIFRTPKMAKKYSIITVNLNNDEGLEKTIRSVIKQTSDVFEYIIIDGGSTDGSTDIISKYADHIDTWVSEPDTGVYNAMNKGIAMATGTYLLFLNSGDTLVEKTTIEHIAPYLETSETDIIYGDLRFDSGIENEVYHYPDELTFEFMYNHSLGHPATFIHRKLFKHVGGYDEDYSICADWVFFTKAICLHDASYRHVPFVIANFTTDGMSSGAENAKKVRDERRRALTGPFKYLTESHENYLRLKKQMDSLRRSKPYRFLRFIGLPKYR